MSVVLLGFYTTQDYSTDATPLMKTTPGLCDDREVEGYIIMPGHYSVVLTISA